MSGTRVTTMSDPLIAPTTSPSSEHAEDDEDGDAVALAFIRTAAVTLVSAIIEATDRSMPPEMTTIAWATAANATGSTPIARPWTWAGRSSAG